MTGGRPTIKGQKVGSGPNAGGPRPFPRIVAIILPHNSKILLTSVILNNIIQFTNNLPLLKSQSLRDSFWLELISPPLLPSAIKIPPPSIPGAIYKLMLIFSFPLGSVFLTLKTFSRMLLA